MEKLLSTRLRNQNLPESYILPPEKRPNNIAAKHKTIPVIDLGQVGKDREALVEEILKASEEFGFFQVINHGLSDKIIKDMLDVGTEFFDMPVEDKMLMYSEDPRQVCRLYSSINYDDEETHFWRDTLRHPVHPVEIYKHLWPSKPMNYREVTETYSIMVRSLGLRLLELIVEGLGLGSGYFQDELSRVQLLAINHYPPCPDPSLTLGLPKHSDPNLITVLLQGDIAGLQVLNEGEWISVEPIPSAFIINLGHILQIISNGKLKSAEHRVVTNSSVTRTTITTFIYPLLDSTIQPAEELVSEANPAKYRSFKYPEFLQLYLALTADTDDILKVFKI
ncbi:Dmr6-like oxygenase [Thalictrum thalictroides]|uniref:Dmr6-like oxygenase n=1 Tax=Thalictrum thalictroides TaxID=46969 RepID=A0A7J6VY91_THATH|nr:Dmr6-like oxygenase [Thalictrum thalictroides]